LFYILVPSDVDLFPPDLKFAPPSYSCPALCFLVDILAGCFLVDAAAWLVCHYSGASVFIRSS